MRIGEGDVGLCSSGWRCLHSTFISIELLDYQIQIIIIVANNGIALQVGG